MKHDPLKFWLTLAMLVLAGAIGGMIVHGQPILIAEGEAATTGTATIIMNIDGVVTSRTVELTILKRGAAGEHILIDASPVFSWFANKRRETRALIVSLTAQLEAATALDAIYAEGQAVATGGRVAAIDGATSGVLNWKRLPSLDDFADGSE